MRKQQYAAMEASFSRNPREPMSLADRSMVNRFYMVANRVVTPERLLPPDPHSVITPLRNKCFRALYVGPCAAGRASIHFPHCPFTNRKRGFYYSLQHLVCNRISGNHLEGAKLPYEKIISTLSCFSVYLPACRIQVNNYCIDLDRTM